MASLAALAGQPEDEAAWAALVSAGERARINRERQRPADALLEFLANLAPAQAAARGVEFLRGGVLGADTSAREATEAAGSLQRGGSYDAGPVTMQALSAIGAPLVGPARGAATLGSGLARMKAGRAAVPEGAPFPQYATEYPPTAPPVLKTDPKTGKQFLGKQTSPEADAFMSARERIIADMKENGYTPYYDPAKRTPVDPSNYPAANVDTLTLKPAKQETVDKYMAAIGAPETRKLLQAAYKRGQELGNADDWYFMGQLESDFVKELGADAGRKAFLDRFAVPMAATTSGNNPTTNLLMAHYLNTLRQRGAALPAAGHEMPSPIGGRYGMTNVRDYEKIMGGGGYQALGADQPKMHNFSRSFIGDLSRAVMDEQMATGMLAKQPTNMVENARKTAYGLLEAPVHAEAQAAGVAPGAFQDVAWAGFKNEPGKPMISHVNDAIERTHRLTGMPRDEIVRRALVRNEIPLYSIGAVPVPTSRGE